MILQGSKRGYMSQLFKFTILSVFMLYVSESFGMLRALNTAATGMAAQEMNVSTISNNIANINTTGYKRQRVEMEDSCWTGRAQISSSFLVFIWLYISSSCFLSSSNCCNSFNCSCISFHIAIVFDGIKV